jgi:hypothetical protein
MEKVLESDQWIKDQEKESGGWREVRDWLGTG